MDGVDKWARGELGNSAAQARAAAEAAFRAAYHGANQPQAVAAGRAATASVGAGAPPGYQAFPAGGQQYSSSRPSRVNGTPAKVVAPEMLRPSSPGAIVGVESGGIGYNSSFSSVCRSLFLSSNV